MNYDRNAVEKKCRALTNAKIFCATNKPIFILTVWNRIDFLFLVFASIRIQIAINSLKSRTQFEMSEEYETNIENAMNTTVKHTRCGKMMTLLCVGSIYRWIHYALFSSTLFQLARLLASNSN